MTEYGIKELMACWLSRDLADGENAAVGANFPIPRAAVLLAHFLHGPNMYIGMGAFRVSLENVGRVMTLKYFSDFRPARWAESAAYFPLDLFGMHNLDAFFISGIQIDAYGNTNLVGILGMTAGSNFAARAASARPLFRPWPKDITSSPNITPRGCWWKSAAWSALWDSAMARPACGRG